MDFEEYLKLSRSRIEVKLKDYLRKKRQEDLPALFWEQGFIDSLEEFVLRGKLLRGSLFLFTVEGLGKKIQEKHLDIACAIEFMHSALLIQDDIIDNDYERRGIKTIFAKYQDIGSKIGANNNYHYGISSAIVVADIAFFYAMDLLSGFKSQRLADIIKLYSSEVYKVILAEGADSVFGQTNKEPTIEEIKDVYLYKTARYTFSLPFEMGVVVAGGGKKLRSDLSKMGELVGIIFQMRDDEIGLFGDQNEIGKPIGSDVRENKKTLIRYYLFDKARENDRKVLDKYFGNENLTLDDLSKIRAIYKKNKIQEIIDGEITNLMDEVWKIFNRLTFKKDYMKILEGLLEFNISRSK